MTTTVSHCAGVMVSVNLSQLIYSTILYNLLHLLQQAHHCLKQQWHELVLQLNCREVLFELLTIVS